MNLAPTAAPRSCKHGLASKFCAICNGKVRAIVQAAPPPMPRKVTIPKRNLKSPKPLFIAGSPYVSCGNCEMPIKKFDGDFHRVGSHDKFTRLDLERKIIIGRFDPAGAETYEVDAEGFYTVRRQSKLILQSKPGCFACWDKQQTEKLSADGRVVFFKK